MDPIASYSDRASVTLFRRRRPLFWLTLAFCGGITLDGAAEPRLPLLGGLFLGSAALASGILIAGAASKRSGLLLSVCGLALALSGGMLQHAVRARIPPADDISRRTSAAPSWLCVQGVILEASREQGTDKPVWTVSVSALGADFPLLAPACGRARIRINAQSEEFHEGDRIELRARIEAPPEVTVPGAFDSAAYMAAEGIRRSGVANLESVRRIAPPSWLRPDLMLRSYSATLAARLDRLLPQDGAAERSSQSALLSALLLGRRDRVDVADREAFSINGAAHLLAIAGWHLQFLTMLLWTALSYTRLGRRRSAWLVIVAVCAYCAMTGAATPVVRATIMIVLYLLAPALSREADPLSALALAALLILGASPAELFTAGFQLSFLAVLALATLYPALDDAWLAWRESQQPTLIAPTGVQLWFTKWSGRVRQLAFISLVAWLGTAPAIAWHMGRMSLLSLPVNLLAVPLSVASMYVRVYTL